MLKLIKADDVPFNSVINYCESFKVPRDYECEVLEYADISEHAYKTALRDEKRNNGYMFYLIDEENPEYLIGIGFIANIKLNYHNEMFDQGCLAFGVRPNERNKGYAGQILSLLIDECKNLGLKEVCISCYEDNIASKKVIEKNGGLFEKEFKNYGRGALKYWIPTEKTKYKVKTLNRIGKRKSN